MCSTKVVEAITSESIKGAAAGTTILPGVGTAIGGVAGAVSGTTKALQTPKPKKIVPEPDPKLAEKQEQARALRNRLVSPGRGRSQTIFSQPTGGGTFGLKTKTGQ